MHCRPVVPAQGSGNHECSLWDGIQMWFPSPQSLDQYIEHVLISDVMITSYQVNWTDRRTTAAVHEG
jgi:hypothetical protein